MGVFYLFVLPAPMATAHAPACTCGSGCSFFSITLHGSHSLTPGERSWMVKVTHLKIDSAMFGQIAARGGGNRAGVPSLVSLLQTARFYLFMEMLLVAERDGKNGDVVSQSCLRRPWRTGELRRPGLDKRGADRLVRPPTDKHTPPCPGLKKKKK